MKDKSRAEKAGIHLAERLIEMINLMDQKSMAKNFYNGFIQKISKDIRKKTGKILMLGNIGDKVYEPEEGELNDRHR